MEVCSELPKLQILVEAASIGKLEKLEATMKEYKDKVGMVRFE